MAMEFEKDMLFHVFNQGNNKQPIFFSQRNYEYFLDKTREHILPFCDIMAYCLMPNHFHYLLYVNETDILAGEEKRRNLNMSIGTMLRSYSRAVNKQEKRSGSLFRQHTKAKSGWIDGFLTVGSNKEEMMFQPDNYYGMICLDYIHQNPVKAKLADKACDWRFSSAREFKGKVKNGICNIELAKELLFPQII